MEKNNVHNIYMGAGILPLAWHKGKIHFLIGKENKHADTPGWADFGGGHAPGETSLQTAIRECSEELTGFLGSKEEIGRLMRKQDGGIIDTDDKRYRTYLLQIDYDEALPRYYNANQRFLQKHLNAATYKKECIFEKSEIRWVTVDELKKLRPKFRPYYREIVDKVVKRVYN